ncbi:MAG: formylglycine-generating enzyme family protein [Thermoguttaceae bacterium]|nr:formylglycine-generating enzyme family protein [Thermoguttaceae bacterium]
MDIEAGARKVLTIKGVDFAFRWRPPGTFQMGSPSSEAERDSDEGPRYEVTLTKGFWMLETPVTQGMYCAIAGSNSSYFKSGDNYPAENVSWLDCQSFCESLNALGGAPEGFAFRLPTEAEWEYACRAGTNAPYFWGATLNGDKANCDGNCPYGGVSKGRYLEKTSAVGSYTPNAWGLYDMRGNVWEQRADWFGCYAAGPQTDPTGPPAISSFLYFRVLRGGSWRNRAENCRSACRYGGAATNRSKRCGFRFVLGR